jgi:GNAT superfamily N-acetyltransferase
MLQVLPYTIVDDALVRADDEKLVALLRAVYVDGGFTAADVAAKAFSPAAVRARGRLLYASAEDGALVGTVVVVPPESEASRLAQEDEAELHLLAVAAELRGQGIGRSLVDAAMVAALDAGYRGMVLWTQPTMHTAHRLYEQAGFVRSPSEDFAREGRTFQVYRVRRQPR